MWKPDKTVWALNAREGHKPRKVTIWWIGWTVLEVSVDLDSLSNPGGVTDQQMQARALGRFLIAVRGKLRERTDRWLRGGSRQSSDGNFPYGKIGGGWKLFSLHPSSFPWCGEMAGPLFYLTSWLYFIRHHQFAQCFSSQLPFPSQELSCPKAFIFSPKLQFQILFFYHTGNQNFYCYLMMQEWGKKEFLTFSKIDANASSNLETALSLGGRVSLS